MISFKSLKFVSRILWRLLTSQCTREAKTFSSHFEISKYSDVRLAPLEPCNDSVEVNVSGSDSSNEQDGITISTTKDWLHGLVSLSEYIENCCSKKSNKLVNKFNIPVFAKDL